jgi:hypothetical protein
MRMRGEVDLLAKQQLAVEVMQGDGGASEGLDQGKLNPRQTVGATKVSLDIGNEAIEQPRSIAAPVNLVPRQQLRLGGPVLSIGLRATGI